MFGGYDPKAIKEGQSLKMFQTINAKTWQVRCKTVAVGGRPFIRRNRNLDINPALTYLYLPKGDFTAFRTEVLRRFPGVACTGQNYGSCKFR
jgi:hypothetical protein